MTGRSSKLSNGEWTPVQGKQGVFAKAATRPEVTNPDIQRALDALNEQFRAIDEAADLRAQQRFMPLSTLRRG